METESAHGDADDGGVATDTDAMALPEERPRAEGESEAEQDGSELDASSGHSIAARRPSERLAVKLSVNLIDTYKLINQR